MLYYHVPRCTHIKTNGTQCGSPALRQHRYCFFQKKWQRQPISLDPQQPSSPLSFTLPLLEDADSVQVAVMQVMRLILARQIDSKSAGLLLYALQTASRNLRGMELEPVLRKLSPSILARPPAVASAPTPGARRTFAWIPQTFRQRRLQPRPRLRLQWPKPPNFGYNQELSNSESCHMSNPIIDKLLEKSQRTDLPKFNPGDTVRVHVKIKEGEKERVQVFEGLVISQRNGQQGSFVVRKMSFGQGVERIFPYRCKVVDKVEVVRSFRVRRAKLYYLRALRGKAARLREVETSR